MIIALTCRFQLELLEGAFLDSQYPDTETLEDLAERLDVSTDKVSVGDPPPLLHTHTSNSSHPTHIIKTRNSQWRLINGSLFNRSLKLKKIITKFKKRKEKRKKIHAKLLCMEFFFPVFTGLNFIYYS